MKFLFLILTFFSLKCFGQDHLKSGVYYSFYAMTNWFFYLIEDNTFEYTSSGHLGFDDTIRGTYRLSGDTVFTKTTNLLGYENNPSYMMFKIQGDSCILELNGIGQLFCKQKETIPIPITANVEIEAAPEYTITKIEMFLDAFGVEANGFPTIQATLNFKIHKSICKVSYYEPWLKSKRYSLTQKEILTILNILEKFDLKQLKTKYSAKMTDQPTSTITIYTNKGKFEIKDYGLIGEYPLNKLYAIVYKLKQNFR